MEKKVKTIVYKGTKEKRSDKQIKNVAAYCRVSTLQEEQDLSYESQCEYFEKLIASRPDMELVGVYGDHGFSGLHVEKRPELQRMLDDARAGKIDLILVKSISRLSRNMIDLQSMVNELNDLGIAVVFEKEGLRSDDAQFELILKFLAACAQEESNSLSQNVRWANQRNNKLGQPTRGCPYGFRKKPREKGEPHVWKIYEPEATLVKMAFNLAKKKMEPRKIAKILNREQGKYPDAKQKKWTAKMVRNHLVNEVYIGDVLTGKTYKSDYLAKKTRVNNGEREQFYIEDHHPAIVSRKLFNEVGQILKIMEGV